MSKGLQIILVIIIGALLVLVGVLAVQLINYQETATPVPTLALQPTVVVKVNPLVYTPTPIATLPTWTPEPTRTPYPTETPRGTYTATPPPTITPTFLPTFTPRPTEVVTSSAPGPTETPGLQNSGFEDIRNNNIPDWKWKADDNFEPGGDYDPDTSYETPLFKLADDPARQINGSTLQIDAVEHLKFRVHVFQTVPVSPTARVKFQVLAGGFSDSGVIQVAAGIDPNGNSNCNTAWWGDIVTISQAEEARTVASLRVKAGRDGLVTVCLYAEPLYAGVSNAAFFDDAELIIDLE